MARIRTLVLAAALAAGSALAQPVDPVLKQAQANKQAYLDTLKSLTDIESGSRDFEGLNRIAALIADRLKALGGSTVSTGGGTDAAFAGLQAKGPVVEGFGLRGFGAHSNDNEYIFIEDIEPKLYLAVRMIMDFSRGKVPTQ